MNGQNQVWAIVLAGGSGNRLSSLTTNAIGRAIPKQYCSLDGGPSLLSIGLRRAEGITDPARVCMIVAAEHRRWWAPLAARVPRDNLIVQPLNRGTGNGVLLALLWILKRDPNARVVFLPSDHYLDDEQVLCTSVHEALRRLRTDPARMMLVGITPEEPDPEFGYIVPGTRQPSGAHQVVRFVEKPERSVAATLIGLEAVWNSMIFATDGMLLRELYERHYPNVVAAMQVMLSRIEHPDEPSSALADFYQRIPSIDFSRDILEDAVEHTQLWCAPRCGWNDLGTPQRVESTIARLRRGARAAAQRERERTPAALDMGEALDRRRRSARTDEAASAGMEGAI